MHKVLRASAVALLSLLPLSAQASKITVMYDPRGGGDPNACIYLQLDNLSPWYALKKSDTLFNETYAMLLSAATSGQSISYFTSGTTCGITALDGVYIGTIH